jgi:hypothetical protein
MTDSSPPALLGEESERGSSVLAVRVVPAGYFVLPFVGPIHRIFSDKVGSQSPLLPPPRTSSSLSPRKKRGLRLVQGLASHAAGSKVLSWGGGPLSLSNAQDSTEELETFP